MEIVLASAIYILLVFALSFFVEVYRKNKIYPKQKAISKALLIGILTTITPVIIIAIFFLTASAGAFMFCIEYLTVTIATIIFIPLAAYFSYRRFIV